MATIGFTKERGESAGNLSDGQKQWLKVKMLAEETIEAVQNNSDVMEVWLGR